MTVRRPHPSAITATPWAVDIEAPSVIPYEPIGDLRAARDRIRAGIAVLVARPGELLHGQVTGSAVTHTDLDNTLLYNIGGRSAAATRYGVALERCPSPDIRVRYRYRLAEAMAADTPRGTVLARFHDLPLGSRPNSWVDIWRAAHGSRWLELSGSLPEGDIHLYLRIGAPDYSGSATGEFVKTLIDGVLMPLHHDPGLRQEDDAVARLAARVDLPVALVSHLLTSDERSVLGPVPRLLCTRGSGLQCRPADDRVTS